MTADEKACAVAAAMWAKDQASQQLGMVITEVGAGRASLAMTVREVHCNGFGLLHGGLLATLADSAFAFACNSGNALTVASGFDISIVKSAEVGDELVAEARCVHQGGAQRALRRRGAARQRGHCPFPRPLTTLEGPLRAARTGGTLRCTPKP